jgi:hypothetical protein
LSAFDVKRTFNTISPYERMSRAYQAPMGFGSVMGEQLKQGVLDSYGLGTVVRELSLPPLLTDRPYRGDTKENFETRQRVFAEKALDEDGYKASPYYRKEIPWERGMTEDRAAALAGMWDQKMIRSHFAEKQPVAAFMGQLFGQAFDPINYIPLAGPAMRAAAIAKAGSIGGRIAIASSEAAIATAAFAVATSGIRDRFGDDTSFNSIVLEIATSALIGGVFGAGIGVLARGQDARVRRAVRDAGISLQGLATKQESLAILNDGMHGMVTKGVPDISATASQIIQNKAAELDARSQGARALVNETALITTPDAPGRVVISPNGSRVEVQPEVVDLGTLVHASGALQVRDRGRIDSQQWVEKTASTLNPALLMPDISSDRGSPLVGADNVIDSGNGRVMALRRAYEAYPDKANEYRSALEKAGFDTTGMERPVLIARRTTPLTMEARAQFNAESNARNSAAMSAPEIAKMDAEAMSDDVLALAADAPITAAANRAFVRAFLSNIPTSEHGALIDADGNLSSMGALRVQNAVTAAAYADADPSIMRRFTEATDDNSRTILAAMGDVAGGWARMRREIARGNIDPAFDPTPSITEAVRLLNGWRSQAAREKRPIPTVIKEGMAQLDLTTGALRDDVAAMLRVLYADDTFTRAMSRERLGALLSSITTKVADLGAPALFERPNVPLKEIIRSAQANGPADLFAPASALGFDEGGGQQGGGAALQAGGQGRGQGDQGAGTGSAASTEGLSNGQKTEGVGRGSGGDGSVSSQPQPELPRPRGREADGSLAGLPRKIGSYTASVFERGQEVARRYMAKAGLAYNPPTTYQKVDPARAKRIADAYDQMEHNPNDPAVKASYDALITETLDQYRAMLDDGLVVEFAPSNMDPYGGNPRNMTEDVRNNNHMWVFSTRDGFGSDAAFDPKDNPLLAVTEFEISGQKAMANDIFRAVHDYFGHVKEGVGFRADGEENAWRSHSAMYSPVARKAMTTETRGQNSWVNYGPFGETNRTAKSEETHYADQKIGILPDWVASEGASDAVGPDDPMPFDLDRYFISDDKTVDVPLDQIDPIRARPEGIANAGKYMRMAFNGEMSKRKGISLRKEVNGRYTLLDGNSTYANAAKNGWSEIRARVLTDEEFAAEEAAKSHGPKEIVRLRDLPNDQQALQLKLLINSAPVRTLDETYEVIPAHQKALGELGEELSQKYGVTFKNGGLKKRPTAEQKMQRKGYRDTRQLTDLVRAGFVVDNPTQAEAIIADLATKWRIVDEGWRMTEAAYFDRKALVQFEDGSVGEVQFWHPDLLVAKKEGHKLYEQMRGLSPDDPEFKKLLEQQRVIYGAVADTVSAEWRPVLEALYSLDGKGGASGNISSNVSSEMRRPLSITSAASTGSQGPASSSTANADFEVMTAGRPSQSKNVVSMINNVGAVARDLKLVQEVDEPAIPGLVEAEARVGKPESLDETAEFLGVDSETGQFDELGDIDQIKVEGRLLPEDEAVLEAAEQDFKNAKAYGKALDAAVRCVI